MIGGQWREGLCCTLHLDFKDGGCLFCLMEEDYLRLLIPHDDVSLAHDEFCFNSNRSFPGMDTIQFTNISFIHDIISMLDTNDHELSRPVERAQLPSPVPPSVHS